MSDAGALERLAALSEEVDAAYRRWWDEEDWARSFELYDELEAARKSYRVALAECWPQLEASKHLPDYDKQILLSLGVDTDADSQ